ncbi:MAG: hypothetical protein KBC17_01340 [Candidatus Pacebacteria bacterium]|nr:hypothetical protein [Candidatus Paceibacterota bacterium]
MKNVTHTILLLNSLGQRIESDKAMSFVKLGHLVASKANRELKVDHTISGNDLLTVTFSNVKNAYVEATANVESMMQVLMIPKKNLDIKMLPN